MSLRAGALIAPISISDASTLHKPFIAMTIALAGALALSTRADRLDRRSGQILIATHSAFILIALATRRTRTRTLPTPTSTTPTMTTMTTKKRYATCHTPTDTCTGQRRTPTPTSPTSTTDTTSGT